MVFDESNSPLSAPIAIVEQASAESVKVSRSVMATALEVQQAMQAHQEQLFRDAVATPSSKVAVHLVTEAKKLQAQIDKYVEQVKADAAPSFTQQDVSYMQKLKDKGTTEKVIAQRFDTNPTKVNRLTNGVIQPDA